LNTDTGSAVMTGRVSTTLIPGGNWRWPKQH
jgi:hypothetical protein